MALRKLDLRPQERNYFRFDAPIFDFEFRREDSEIVLAFSAKKDVTRELLVRLYEVKGHLPRHERRAAVVDDSEFRELEDGFEKSNRFVIVDSPKTLTAVALDHGFADDRALRGHFNNRFLISQRGEAELETDDLVFVPQLAEFVAVPLGPVLSVEDASEAVPDDGHRHEARWDCEAQHYDPLDPEQWVNDALLSTGPTNHPRSNVTETEARQLWFPQFAVLTAEGTVLAVSPTPPELARETDYQLVAEEDPDAFAVVSRRPSRFLSADQSKVTFEVTELPLGAYGAIDPTTVEAD